MVLANNIGGRGRQLLLPYAIYGAFAFFAMVLEKNDFFEPIVCHGYGSVLMIQMSIYKNTKEQQFLVNLEENIEATLKCHEEWMEKERYIKNYSLFLNLNVLLFICMFL